MKPLRVTFHLGGHVAVSDGPIHLDGLLAWASVQEALARGDLDLDRAAEALPLARKGEPSVWCASTLQFDFLDVPDMRLMIRRTDVEDMAKAIEAKTIELKREYNQIITSSGPMRNYLLTFPVRPCQEATAWCLGDEAQVRRLLGRIHFVGKNCRMGLGRVSRIDITEDPEASSKWKLRHLPWQEPGYVPVTGNFKAPYWDKAAAGTVYTPAA